MNPKKKRCPHCGQEKTLDQFGVARKSKDGRQSWCISCTREYTEMKKLYGRLHTCRRCNKSKPVSAFEPGHDWCLECEGKPEQLTIEHAIEESHKEGSTKTYFANATPETEKCKMPGIQTMTDDQLLQELKRRGYNGQLTKKEVKEVTTAVCW